MVIIAEGEVTFWFATDLVESSVKFPSWKLNCLPFFRCRYGTFDISALVKRVFALSYPDFIFIGWG